MATGLPPNWSAFGVNQSRKISEFTDGTSNTLLMSEVKAYTPYVRDCGGFSQINDPNNVPSPDADPLTVCPEYAAGGCTFLTDGHSEWAEIVHHIGFTTAWTPNKKTPGGPGLATPDVDINSQRERTGGPTFAAITSQLSRRRREFASRRRIGRGSSPPTSTAKPEGAGDGAEWRDRGGVLTSGAHVRRFCRWNV
ncbi:MAG: DUF1559 domain-containing protein [Planctomycetaceae bacterium]